MAAPLNLEDVLRLLDEYYEDRKRAEADVKFTPYYEQTRDRLVEEVTGDDGYSQGYRDGQATAFGDIEERLLIEYHKGYDRGWRDGHDDGKKEMSNARAA
jgi:hypothetical protein